VTTPRHRLHIVSGKGGTGKTTIAGALACSLATAGRRVLMCEVEGRQGVAELFGADRLIDAEERRICRTPAGGVIYGLAIDAEDAFLAYLDRFGAVDFATSIAPGLRDVLLTGKVYEAVRRSDKGRPNAYDAVVLDAPPTGRIAQFLNVHAAVAGLARIGPIRGQADSIMRMLKSTTTAVHLVTLLEEMPVTETEEAVAALGITGIPVQTVIENKVNATPLDVDQLHRVSTGTTMLQVRGLTDRQNRLLTAEFADEAERTLQQRERHLRLTSLGVLLAEVAFDPAGIDEAALFSIAEQLQEQIDLEVRQ
jgi:anion-transporting  ArsA/GET3 family ATPase